MSELNILNQSKKRGEIIVIEHVRCSIDRLTIIAEYWSPYKAYRHIEEQLKQYVAKYDDLGYINYDEERGKSFGVRYIEENEFGEVGKNENIIFFNIYEVGKEVHFRIDLNPNTLKKYNAEHVWKHVRYHLSLLKCKLRLSRFDLAFDLFNAPEVQAMVNLRGGVTENRFLSRQRTLETVYWGSQSSSVQVRLYDKKKEQRGVLGASAYYDIETDEFGRYKVQIEDWWRLEMQLRTKVIDEKLADLVAERLNDFSMSGPFGLDLKSDLLPFACIYMETPEKVALAFPDTPVRTIGYWKSKVRKAIRESNDDYIEIIKKALQRDTEKLCQELKKYCDVYLGF